MTKYSFVFFLILSFKIGAFAQANEFYLGIESVNQGNFQTALERFLSALQQNPTKKQSAKIFYNIGVCFYRLNQPQRAAIEFEKAILLKKDYEKAFYALGMAQTTLQNWDEAKIAFLQAIKLSKGRNGEVWFDLAFVFIEQKDFESALKSFQNAIKFGSIASLESQRNVEVLSEYLNSKNKNLFPKILFREVR